MNKLYSESSIQAIADAIRAKTGSSDTFTVGDMADAVEGLPPLTEYFKTSSVANLSGFINKLETGDYHTGTVTVSSYFPAKVESLFCDTGYTWEDGDVVIWIIDDATTVSRSSSEHIYFNFGIFARNVDDETADYTKTTGFLRYQGNVNNAMFTASRTAYRVNNGKLYITPTYAQSNYTHFITGRTYRWFAYKRYAS